jgi:hypothetical protein
MSNEEMPEFMKHVLGMFKIVDLNAGTWVNVAKLNSEDQLKKKNHDMQIRRLMSEGKVLNDKLQLLHATIQAAKSEFWDGVYKTYSLPSDLSYRIDDTGQVLKHVAEPPPGENK